MAYASLTIVLEKVTMLLTSNDKIIDSAAENELQQLKTEVNILQSFLEQGAKLPKKDEVFRKGERKIMKVANTIEETIESSLIRAQNRTKLLPQGFYGKRLTLAQDVKSLRKETVEPMLEEAKMLFDVMLTGVQKHLSSDQIHEPPPIIGAENIVGLEDEQDTIMNYLRETSKELDVISIIGMAGLGKTTLAWKIYTNGETRYEFPICIWVNVYGQGSKRKNLLLEILRFFPSRDMSSLSDQDLSHLVHQHLEKAKFLLVIDDVWSVDIWNAIRDALPQANGMGKVLITSRYTNVGRHVSHTREPHRLRFMTRKESWDLLKLEVVWWLGDYPEELVGIDSYTAKQCDGLPLAIVCIGGVCSEMLRINKWNMAFENMSMILENAMLERKVSDIVASSYNRLPHDLRDCLLYLGVFPENFEIPIWALINLWIAEGLIQPKRGKSLEETAEENLKDLINRNLVMVEKTNHMGKVKTCRIHVVIHAFCRSKAAITERNLFQEVAMSEEGVFKPSIDEIQEHDRICIHSNLLKFLSQKPSSQNLRSLLCFYKKPVILDSECFSDIADAFCLLRVLATNSIKFNQFPIGVTRLNHLSFIALCGDDLEIPEAISQLRNLQTIVVDTNSLSLTIKANIWRMVLLKHVKTKAAIVLDIQAKEGNAGENLRTLSRLSPKSCTRGVFNRARNVKKLGIRGQLATLDARCLRKLGRLENLKLVNDSQKHGLPHQALNYFPGNLKTLSLSATYLNWQHMSKLGKIDTLQVLKLTNYAFTGLSWNTSTSDRGFRCLEFLLIASTDLVLWEASADHFPRLSFLVLKNCEKLSKIPMGVTKSLKKLEIENLSKSAVDSAREIGKEKGASGFKLSIGPARE